MTMIWLPFDFPLNVNRRDAVVKSRCSLDTALKAPDFAYLPAVRISLASIRPRLILTLRTPSFFATPTAETRYINLFKRASLPVHSHTHRKCSELSKRLFVVLFKFLIYRHHRQHHCRSAKWLNSQVSPQSWPLLVRLLPLELIIEPSC